MVIHSSRKAPHFNNLTAEEYEILLFVEYCNDFSSTNQLKDSTEARLSVYVGMSNPAVQKGLLLKQTGKKRVQKILESSRVSPLLKNSPIFLVTRAGH